ncbi:MAG: TonB-dependent receptor [Bacteroidetes bacterium]|nr:TonB-dependent receptor [Bacteroidota bacterium]
MYKKLLYTFVGILASGYLFSQSGAIKVTLKDKATKETIPFANVVAELNGVQAGGATTNIDGEAFIKPLTPGKYNVKATYVGYQAVMITGVNVSPDKTEYVTIELQASSITINEVVIVEYTEPLIDPDTKSGSTVTREEFQNLATRDVNGAAALTAGVYQNDGGGLNFRGSRAENTQYVVDGMRVIGSANVSQQSVENITTITGGIPAQYGDVTGGVVAITTRGPQSKFMGGVEARTSQFLDPYGHNYIGFSLGGPIITKRDTAKTKTVLGYFVGGEIELDKDPYPSAIGFWKVKDDKLKYLEENPLRRFAGSDALVREAEFITKDDMEEIKVRQNVASRAFRLNTKVDYKPTDNLNITLGGSIDYGSGHSFVYEYALLNPVNNPAYRSNTWRVFGRITQRFGDPNLTKEEIEKSTALIKNAYYTLQGEYEGSKGITEDDTHKDDHFAYGYVGKFKQYKSPYYQFKSDGPMGDAFYMIGEGDVALTFQPGDVNTEATNWTEQLYNLVGTGYTTNGGQYGFAQGNFMLQQGNVAAGEYYNQGITTGIDIIQNNGLLNGTRPGNLYGLWYNTGRQYGGYAIGDNTRFRVSTSFSADIKKHALQVGLEWEQRSYRDYNLTSIGLWDLMAGGANSGGFANFHLSQLDTVPIFVPELSGTYNYYRYDKRYDASQQYYFDKKLREKLGLPVDGTDFIDVNSLDPSLFSLDMFSPDELYNQGNGIVSYRGYHTGKRTKGRASFSDFFNKRDATDSYFTREVPAFTPVYMAGYIQDKFDFRDMKFNVGVRIDRYDANQYVPKDMYVFDEVYTAKEIDFDKYNATRPSNIGDDFVVYVNDASAGVEATTINGYRDGDQWYTADGKEVTDWQLIAGPTGIAPMLKNPTNVSGVSEKAFEDYTPQVNVMPRIAFSFPISDVANFFAHYDILTQRPSDGYNAVNPFNYLYLQNRGGAYTPNPNLKPSRTTDYELGFSQILNERKNSSLTISAFYRELRDMQQIIRINGAYPVSYLTTGNIDFGTVKGLSVAYDLRRRASSSTFAEAEGVQLSANYTLQFADGTGSGATDAFNLANSGQPNLRTLVPLDFDQRHRLVLNLDYRFGTKTEYKGPTVTRKKDDTDKTIKVLEDVGFNLTLNAGSGTPYTQQANPTQTAASGIAQRAFLKGNIRGARLPWQFRGDIRIDKNFIVKWGDKDDDNRKQSNLNVYVLVYNILNTKNVVGVYPYTGNPDDDGYLTSAAAQSEINANISPASFIDLYSIKVNNPYNYSLPRRIRLGITLDF